MKTRSLALIALLVPPVLLLGYVLNVRSIPSSDLRVRNRNTARFSVLPRFEAAGTFREGIAPVKRGERWGFVDPDGDWVIEPRFRGARSFREGRAAVKTSRGWGFVDTGANWVIDPQYRDARSFHEGRAAVRSDSGWSFVTRAGRVIAPFEFDWVGRFRQGRAVVSRGESKGYLNRAGDTVLEQRFADAGAFGKEWAPVRTEDGWGYVNENGERVVQHRYEWASPPQRGLARVRRNDQWYFLRKETGGTEAVPGSFVGKPRAQGLVPNRVQGRIGYLDRNGEQRIEPRFDQGLAFRNGLAPVKQRGLWGYVDTSGDWVIQPKFNAAGPFTDGRAPVKVGSEWGYIPHPERSPATGRRSSFWVDTGVHSVDPGRLNESLADQFPTWRYRGRDRYVRVVGTDSDHWVREPLVPRSNYGKPNAKYEVTRYPYEQPTYVQFEAAEQFYWRSVYVAQSRNWFSARVGVGDGFGLNGMGGVDSHYFKEKHMLDGHVLVPSLPESLIYYGEQARTARLGGAMFYHSEPRGTAPQIGGPLTPWHYHVFDEPVCHEGVMVRPFDRRCEDGEFRERSPEMIHTWFIDHPNGSFATETNLVENRENTFHLAFNPTY